MPRPTLGFSAPPSLSIPIGATTPNPGKLGVTVWSTSANQELVWDGLQWSPTAELFPDLPDPGYLEILRTGSSVSSIIMWADATKMRKVKETTISRAANGVSSVTVKQYDGQGVLVQTLTSTISRTTEGRVAGVTTVRV
jgi:hypothetical protein